MTRKEVFNIKVNKEYILEEAFNYYRIEHKLEVYNSLAEDLGVSQRTITRFLNTKTISKEMLLGIQSLLKLDVTKIFIDS
ncbi:hypothetical protein FORC3_1206 [Clostridium perfringens]|uniref:hypothetical protein n=1 Tax=Clostridium perfringens TaxID=1502 RepID=UPI000706DD5C|nr:hypothetical protein [Clostridium perfringens]ALG48583.1 hypothetical protein FORC3_1206 [Clostridium perfringens]